MTNGTGIGLAKSPEVDAEASGSTVITEIGENEEFYPMVIGEEVTEASGVITPGTYSVGTNSPNYNNIISLATVGGAVALDNILASGAKVPEETEIRVRMITTSIATSHKFKIRIFGNLISN